MGGVLDDRQAVLGSNGIDGIHVGALAVQGHGDDGAGAGGDGGFQLGRVQGVGARVDVDVNRLGAQQGDGFGRDDIGETRGDDFVAWADAQGHLGDLQCISAVGDGDAMLGADVGGQALFQLGDLRPQDELAVCQHALDVGIDIGFQALVLGVQVDELHGFVVSGSEVKGGRRDPQPDGRWHRYGSSQFRRRRSGAGPAVHHVRSSSRSGGRARRPSGRRA